MENLTHQHKRVPKIYLYEPKYQLLHTDSIEQVHIGNLWARIPLANTIFVGSLKTCILTLLSWSFLDKCKLYNWELVNDTYNTVDPWETSQPANQATVGWKQPIYHHS